jgi:acetyl-CoA carboxylase biotin carboxyl carrier protein
MCCSGFAVAVINMAQVRRRFRLLRFRLAQGGVAMALTHEDVANILKIIDESDYDEVRLEFGDLKLHVQKHGALTDGGASLPMRIEARTPAAAAPAPAAPVPPAASAARAAPTAIPPGMVAVRAPMLGTFYRASAPGESPFVEVGDKVSATDTVCLVEVMKLFNSVKAGVAGTVVSILADNATMVEFDQALVIIDPA